MQQSCKQNLNIFNLNKLVVLVALNFIIIRINFCHTVNTYHITLLNQLIILQTKN